MLIHVICPSCTEPYDIADTFAGGVYRCAKCNTLMSVPKDPAPNAPKGKSPPPDGAEALANPRDGSQASVSPSTPQGRKPAAKPGAKTVKAAGKNAPAKSLWNTYKVHIISIGATVLLLSVALLIIRQIKSTPEIKVVTVRQPVQPTVPAYQFPYLKGVFVNSKPNVLGLPLAGNVTVVIDGASDLDGVRASIHKLVLQGLANKDIGTTTVPQVTLVYANGQAAVCPATPIKDGSALSAFLGGVSLKNAKRDSVPDGLVPALQAACNTAYASKTRQIVLVLGRKLTRFAESRIVQTVEPAVKSGIQFDVVAVDADTTESVDLTDLISQSRGRLAPVTAGTLSTAAASAN